jgi:hypothetical protein
MPDEIHNNTVDDEQKNLAKLETLKAAIAEGLASGIAPDGSRERVHRRIRERAASEPRPVPMWTNTMPAEPGWYWTRIKGGEPEVCQLVDHALWTSDRELGMLDKYVEDHCLVWGEPIRPPAVT